ncbi:MAG: (d)CMP kinase [Sphingomonadales bacterium]|jgi:cytidylate kinase
MNKAQKSFTIAIDGPAASGKGTLARNLSSHLGLRHLDSGSLYRAVALSLLNSRISLDDESAAVKAAEHLDEALLGTPELRLEHVGRAASQVAKYPGVRKALLDFQRRFAKTPPGAVIDGRDIGTIVCPDADVKIFLTASPKVRAERRALELEGRGESVDRAKLIAEIKERDRQDEEREVAPLKPAQDAVLLDASNLDIEAALAAALKIVNSK